MLAAVLTAPAVVVGCVGNADLFPDDPAGGSETSPPPPGAGAMGSESDTPVPRPDAPDQSQSQTTRPSEFPIVPSTPPPMAPATSSTPVAVEPAPAPEPVEPAPPPPEPDPTGGARLCSAPAQPELLDFGFASDSATEATFGDFASVLSGGTYVYPDAVAAELPAVLGLRSDMSDGDWHITGAVAEPAGFGLFLDCQQLDASGFVGLAFRLQGDSPEPALLSFVVNSAANEVSRQWLLDVGNTSPGPSFGRCTPVEAQFDGSCHGARVTLPVPRDGSEVVVRFAELGGGSPEPQLNPAEITSIQWALPAPSTDADGAVVPYAVDLRLDDIRFIAE